MNWTQPMCSEDYARLYPGRRPYQVIGDYRESETCCMCGQITWSGIFVRIDPRTVPHPKEEDR